jgi:hypothetical protein
MPLLDHFHPPLRTRRRWEGFHHAWAGTIVNQLNEILPRSYHAEASVHLGGIEIDAATLVEPEDVDEPTNGGGIAVALWAPPQPKQTVPLGFDDPDVFEIRVYNETAGPHVVAAIELISPGNTDRPSDRRQFAAKCAAYLQAKISLVMVDVVTERSGDLHAELFDLLGIPANSEGLSSSGLYAAAYRTRMAKELLRLEYWHEPLDLGSGLPTLPLWVSPERCLPLDLERAYAAACASSRIG